MSICTCQKSIGLSLRMGALVLASLLAPGCAVLQDVNYLDRALLQADGPTVTNAQGTLSKNAGKKLLAGRWKSSYGDAKAMAALEELATGRPLIAGNRLTLLYDGPQTMASMVQAISAAKDHINLETYIFDQDAVGLQFADLLIERQRAGVQVHVIYDSVGTMNTPQSFFDRMRTRAFICWHSIPSIP